MGNDYTPISCTFYDELEAAAVKKTESTIVYQDNDETNTITDTIVDFRTMTKQEFCILKSGLEIRLDKIISFNGIKPSDKNYC